MEYLHRLNVAAKHAKIAIKKENVYTAATRRKQEEFFIAMLDDLDLAKQITQLRLKDINEIEETLLACQRMESSGESVDGIEQIPLADEGASQSNVIQDNPGSEGGPRESRKQRSESDSIGSDVGKYGCRVSANTTPDQ
uniref:Transposase n=1 Tax=Peronospora matthiolae TaxID=2874970 RepID=A0AAV1TMG7_9STRA